MAPKYVEELIKKQALEIRNRKQNTGLNILVIDDAVGSGRTQETLIRALIRVARNQYNDNELSVSPLNMICSYGILDRQGKARGTLLDRY